MSRAVPSGGREGMFPDRYSQIFGIGERLGCILNLGHCFDATERIFEFASMSITLAHYSVERDGMFRRLGFRDLGVSNPAWADLAWSSSSVQQDSMGNESSTNSRESRGREARASSLSASSRPPNQLSTASVPPPVGKTGRKK